MSLLKLFVFALSKNISSMLLKKRRAIEQNKISLGGNIREIALYNLSYPYFQFDFENSSRETKFKLHIAHLLFTKEPSIPILINSSSKADWVFVTPDKRLKKIVVTEKGLESHKKVIERLNEIDSELVSCLTKEELETFKVVLEKLKEGLKVD